MSKKEDLEVYVKAIRREANILLKDAHRTPQRLTMAQRAESIIALCNLLEKRLDQ